METQPKRARDVATLLGCSKDTVVRYCKLLQIGTFHNIGGGVSWWEITDKEVELIAERFKGRCGRRQAGAPKKRKTKKSSRK